MHLNADIPQIRCWMRTEYLYNLESHFGKFVKCVVFGVASIPGQAILFHCLTETGAQIARMPLSAFVHKKEAPVLPLDMLELWDSYSYEISVHAFHWLKSMRCRVFMKNDLVVGGEYMFTLDWSGSTAAEAAGDIGHKNAHIIKLDNGCFAAQPNNRILWEEPSSISVSLKKRPKYLTNSHVWHAEVGNTNSQHMRENLRTATPILEELKFPAELNGKTHPSK